MPQPTAGDVHVNRPLTNISIAMVQDAANFVAARVFPSISVASKSDTYYVYDRGEFNRDEMEERAPSTETAGGGYTVDATPTYNCRLHGFHKDIDDQIRSNADSQFQLDREATIFVTNKALVKREKLWVSKFFAGGLWTNDWDGVSAGPGANQVLQWSDPASTPIENVRAAKTSVLESTGFRPNTLVLGQRVADALMDHPDFVDRVKYGQTNGGPAMVDEAVLARLFGVERVMVMAAIENTAAKGATNAHSFIGGKKALLCYSAPTPGLMTPSAGYTFSWTGHLGAGAEGNRIKKFRMENLSSDRVEIEMAFDQKMIAADLGFFWDTIVA